MSLKQDILKKYTGKAYPPLQKTEQQQTTQLVKADTDYEAIKEVKRGNRSPRFKIVDANGVSYGCSYAHLIDWVYMPPTLLTVNTASRIFTIEGKNLEKIERLLMDERIKELHTFDEKKHQKPDDEMTIIEQLTIVEQS